MRSEATFPGLVFLAELVGTALLVAVGLSIVIVDFGLGSPLVTLLPDPGARRLLTGFLFGATGGLLALSPVGRESGAHLNPVVTLSFWWSGKLRLPLAALYLTAQLAGGVLGALPLLAFGQMGRSVHFGATVPGDGYGAGAAFLGEAGATFALIFGLFSFLSRARLRPFTPALFPVLYAVLVWLEAPVSGTSTNPARSLGPAIVSGDWRDGWVYWAGPLLGALLAVAVYRSGWLRRSEIEVAKLFHFAHDRYGVFHPRGGA